MNGKREAGVLCHISSLNGEYAIGSLGKEAHKFAKLLAKSGVTYWQILPLVQTGFGDSPYQSVSCTSGNPYFIDLPLLKEEGLLTKEELKGARAQELDYGRLYEERYPLLRKAFSRFNFDGEAFRAFVKRGEFEDYALFMTAKTVYGGSFPDWDEPLKHRDPEALEALRTDYHEEYLFWHFLQYKFWGQWNALKEDCNRLGLKLIGDIPLYVACDSADVWAHPELFKLGEDLRPTKVAGVPPDYFSKTGQLWGNPVYDWAAHERENFAWWTARLENALKVYDVVRIDHFRGIDRYYEIDAGSDTAEHGVWQEGPKEKLFANIHSKGRIIAEDLGNVDDGVRTLLKKTGFPGMRVLLFGFDGSENNENAPENIVENCVVYTGTHDNDTAIGYADKLSAEEFILFRSRVAQSLEAQGGSSMGAGNEGLRNAFLQLAMSSKAELAVIPVQDILGLDDRFRMNTPGTEGENWTFRLKKQPAHRAMRRLKKLIKLYRR